MRKVWSTETVVTSLQGKDLEPRQGSELFLGDGSPGHAAAFHYKFHISPISKQEHLLGQLSLESLSHYWSYY